MLVIPTRLFEDERSHPALLRALVQSQFRFANLSAKSQAKRPPPDHFRDWLGFEPLLHSPATWLQLPHCFSFNPLPLLSFVPSASLADLVQQIALASRTSLAPPEVNVMLRAYVGDTASRPHDRDFQICFFDHVSSAVMPRYPTKIRMQVEKMLTKSCYLVIFFYWTDYFDSVFHNKN